MTDIAKRLRGSITALITPFRDGRVDEAAYRAFIDWQIAEGTHGLVPCGTTGESPTLSHEEHRRVIAICVEQAAGRVPVIAGTGSNATDEAIELTQFAADAGADAALIVLPYYNRPTQEGLVLHFEAIARATAIPLIVYNVPGRTVADVTPETLGRIAKLPHVVGIKDATAKLERIAEHTRLCGRNFVQLSGEDATALGFNAHGGVGCISVTANVAPRLCAQMQEKTLEGDYAGARAINDRLAPLHAALFVETSPAPVKYAVSRLGRAAPDCRLPLAPLGAGARAAVDGAMQGLGLV